MRGGGHGERGGGQFLAAITTERATPPRATAVAPNSHFHGTDCGQRRDGGQVWPQGPERPPWSTHSSHIPSTCLTELFPPPNKHLRTQQSPPPSRTGGTRWSCACRAPAPLTQAPLPGHLAGSRLGLPSILRYRAVSVLRWAACFFTSLDSSAWIVCGTRGGGEQGGAGCAIPPPSGGQGAVHRWPRRHGQRPWGFSRHSRAACPRPPGGKSRPSLTLLEGSSFKAARRMGMASLYSPCCASTCAGRGHDRPAAPRKTPSTPGPGLTQPRKLTTRPPCLATVPGHFQSWPL